MKLGVRNKKKRWFEFRTVEILELRNWREEYRMDSNYEEEVVDLRRYSIISK